MRTVYKTFQRLALIVVLILAAMTFLDGCLNPVANAQNSSPVTPALPFGNGISVCAATLDGTGVLVYPNGGTTWAQLYLPQTLPTFVNTGYYPNVNDLAVTESSNGTITVYAATNDGLVVGSGPNWNALINWNASDWNVYSSATTSGGFNSTAVAGVAVNGSNIYAATNAGLAVSSNGGLSWNTYSTTTGNGFRTALNNSQVLGIFVDPGTPSNLYAATSSGLLMSTNGGTNWARPAAGFPSVGYIFTTFAAGSNIYVGTPGGISYSTNGGASWTDVGQSAGLFGAVDGIVFAGTASNPTILAATVNGLAATTVSNLSSWQYVNTAVYPTLNSVTVGPTTSSIYLATDAGINLSTDSGQTWNQVLTSNIVSKVVITKP